jgi:hypothetical protein
MTGGPVVAIDFGTSYSSAVVVIGDRIVPVKEPTTHGWSFPSTVCRTDRELLVGTAAENAKRSRPGGYRSEFKRDFGQEAPLELESAAYPVEDLVAALLAALREQADQLANQPIQAAVLTVPVDYGPSQRALMVAAASKAGFTGPVTVLDEPVAAAFAPAHGPMPGPAELMLVYDLGGGTFDVALLEADSSGFRVVGKEGLSACGGGDIDRLLYGWFRDQADAPVRELLTIGPDADAASRQATRDLRQSLLEFLRLHVKHQLSSSRTVHDTFVAGSLRVPVDMDQDEFRELIEPIISDTVACCRELLRSRHHQPADLAAVLLVGGGTRMPVVTQALTAEFGRPLRHVEDPELAVALGAAYWAYEHPAVRMSLAESIAVPGGPTAFAATFGPADSTPLAVSGGIDGTLRLWNLADGTPGLSCTAHDGVVTSVDVSADGRTVASGGRDGIVQLWHPGASSARTLFCHADWVNTVRISPDGSHVLSASDDGHWLCSRVLSARAGAAPDGAAVTETVAEGRMSGTRVVGGALSAVTPGLCAIADSAGMVRFSNGTQVSADLAAGVITALALDTADQWVAAGYADGTVRAWALPLAGTFARFPVEEVGLSAVRDLRFGPTGLLASGHDDGTVRLWDPESGTGPQTVGCHESSVRAVAFPAGDLVFSAGADGHVRPWPAHLRTVPSGRRLRPSTRRSDAEGAHQ